MSQFAKKHRGLTGLALVLVIIGIGFLGFLAGHASLPAAQAQTGGNGLGGSGAVGADIYTTVTGSATNGLTVVAPPAGQKYVLRSLILTSGTSGAIILKNCPKATAPIVGTTVGNVAVIANTPVILDDRFFGSGIGMICSSTDDSLSVTQSGATVTGWARFTPF